MASSPDCFVRPPLAGEAVSGHGIDSLIFDQLFGPEGGQLAPHDKRVHIGPKGLPLELLGRLLSFLGRHCGATLKALRRPNAMLADAELASGLECALHAAQQRCWEATEAAALSARNLVMGELAGAGWPHMSWRDAHAYLALLGACAQAAINKWTLAMRHLDLGIKLGLRSGESGVEELRVYVHKQVASSPAVGPSLQTLTDVLVPDLEPCVCCGVCTFCALPEAGENLLLCADIVRIADHAPFIASPFERYFRKGLALHILQRNAEAADCLEKAVALKPEFLPAYGAFDAVVAELGDFARSRRVHQTLSDRGLRASCWQRPQHFLPNLVSCAWHDPQGFDLCQKLERHSKAILLELSGLLGSASEWSRVGTADRGNSNSVHDNNLIAFGDWREMPLLGDSPSCKRNCEMCPITTQVLTSCEEVRRAAELKLGEALFSKLMPGTRLRPHCGPTNMRLTCHLGLRVPEGASIKCGGEERRWEEGRCLVFDDSYEHEVDHCGDMPRTVLLVNFWHPNIDPHQWKDLVEKATGGSCGS